MEKRNLLKLFVVALYFGISIVGTASDGFGYHSDQGIKISLKANQLIEVKRIGAMLGRAKPFLHIQRTWKEFLTASKIKHDDVKNILPLVFDEAVLELDDVKKYWNGRAKLYELLATRLEQELDELEAISRQGQKRRASEVTCQVKFYLLDDRVAAKQKMIVNNEVEIMECIYNLRRELSAVRYQVQLAETSLEKARKRRLQIYQGEPIMARIFYDSAVAVIREDSR